MIVTARFRDGFRLVNSSPGASGTWVPTAAQGWVYHSEELANEVAQQASNQRDIAATYVVQGDDVLAVFTKGKALNFREGLTWSELK